MIIPIFIHVHEKSDKEIREEMERERRWHDAVKREEERKRAKEREEQFIKQAEQEERRKKIHLEYERKRFENPWDYSFLPEGWCIFGTPLKIVEEI